MLNTLTHEASHRAEGEAAAARARLETLSRRRKEAEEAAAKAAEASAAAADNFDWTRVYSKWDTWEDAEELAAAEESEKQRLERMAKRAPAHCSHDHAAERAIYEMPLKDQIRSCREFKDQGNILFREGQFGAAAERYRKVLIYYEYMFPDDGSAEERTAAAIRMDSVLNYAACAIRVGLYDEAIEHLDQALYSDVKNVKALYRRAQAYRHKDEFAKARADISAALALAPKDVDLRREAALLKNKIASYRSRSKEVAKEMFSGRSHTAGGAEGSGDGEADSEAEAIAGELLDDDGASVGTAGVDYDDDMSVGAGAVDSDVDDDYDDGSGSGAPGTGSFVTSNALLSADADAASALRKRQAAPSASAQAAAASATTRAHEATPAASTTSLEAPVSLDTSPEATLRGLAEVRARERQQAQRALRAAKAGATVYDGWHQSGKSSQKRGGNICPFSGRTMCAALVAVWPAAFAAIMLFDRLTLSQAH